MALASHDEPVDDPLSLLGSEPLVPILHLGEGQADQVALSTWHQALSNTASVEVPHDLMGLWLYPAQGGAVLVGPAELAADDLAVPVPSPHLRPEQLTALEEIVLKAGYGSVTCLPIRFGKRDVALLLVADLQPGRYGASERVLLQCVAQRVAPMLGRIARQWTPVEASSSPQQERVAGLLEAVAQANQDAGTPQRFISGVSRGLAPLLPHDHVELLLGDAAGEQYYRLGEHAGGPIWTDPTLAISREHLDVAAIFDTRTRLLVPDAYEDARWPRGFLTSAETAGADIRAVLGVQVSMEAESSAYLLVGSIGPEMYGSDDLELLGLLAGLIAPQIAGFIRAGGALQSSPVRSEVQPAERIPESRDTAAETLLRIAGLLATTSDLSRATDLIAREGAALLPFEKLSIVLRLGGDRVVLLEPGEQRALPEMPLVPVTGTALQQVLHNETPSSLSQGHGDSRLIVPLRIAGRVHGALLFTAGSAASLDQSHLTSAQRLADIAAAHLELLRLAGSAVTPVTQVDRSPRGLRALPATPPPR
jgi:hypothetical protein